MALFGLFGYTDEQILSGLAAQDNAVVRYVYKKYFGYVANMVRKNSGTEQDAQDVFQEGIILLIKSAQNPDFKLVDTAVKTYLYRVCQNMWLKRLQRTDRQKSRESVYAYWLETDETQETDPQQREMLEGVMEQIPDLLAGLGSPCQNILSDYYFAQKSMNDIAQAYGYKDASSAKNQKYKCLNRLKTKVAHLLPQLQNTLTKGV
ncbi:RNA polymerase sigma factor, sigma-70 family [Flexibacter flexilis DSM 6793]|uniref:RNA polymerase sigma factor, sigma-70 family n=1 Tax=Flexibacter flexilis DSM 6793 TaxID=927664 RepID=A0A1I1J5U7_9BACT|nr:sigma-70 family RNA polymerase sigma factor [Flexibacter flexilis]SFC43894.1 RNA polymerase sigma factor, sigma-70 family [Flexibacter flexilis DSM 6793]